MSNTVQEATRFTTPRLSDARSSQTRFSPDHGDSSGEGSSRAYDFLRLTDPRLADEKSQFIRSWLLGIFLSCLFMFIFLSVYWGAYFRQPQQLHRLTVALIDLDSPASTALGLTPVLGPILLSAVTNRSLAGGKYHMSWIEVDNTPFDISEGTGGAPRGLDVHEWSMKAVHDEDYFGVIVANANATSAPVDAFNTLITGAQVPMPYMGEGALTIYFAEARNFDTEDQWVQTGLSALFNRITPVAAVNLVSQLSTRLGALSNAEYAAVNKTSLSSIIAKPFGSSVWNILPFDEFAGIAATTIGLIYLLIFTFFVSLFWNGARGQIQSKLNLKSLLVLRIAVPVFEYFFLSLWISLISLAFHVKFDRFYGKGGFVIFWLSNFLCQWGLGMYMEIALSWLGPRYTAFFLIGWVILNISVSFIDIADQAHFYSYGLIMPVYQAVGVAKSVAFGTKNRLGQNFGVELAWIAVGVPLLGATVVVQRRKELKSMRQGRKDGRQE